MNPDENNKIQDLENRINVLEENRWIFPVKLSQLEKKSINKVMFLYGSTTIAGGGISRATFPGLNPNMVVMATYNGGAPISPLTYRIQASVLIPGQYEILFSGDIGALFDFVVFLIADKSQNS